MYLLAYFAIQEFTSMEIREQQWAYTHLSKWFDIVKHYLYKLYIIIIIIGWPTWPTVLIKTDVCVPIIYTLVYISENYTLLLLFFSCFFFFFYHNMRIPMKYYTVAAK